MKFVIWVIDQEAGSANSNEMAAIDAFNDSLRAQGQWVMAAGIASPTDAILIDNRSDLNQQSEGSLFIGPDYYSGFWIIEVANREIAIELAKRGSRACNRRVELRAFLGQ